MAQTIDTRTVAHRRALYFDTLDDLSAEVDRIVAAAREGRVRPLGNWTAAQVLQHVGRLIEFSFDGFPFRYPWPLRWASWLVGLVSWRALVALAFRPGFRNPPVASPLEPGPGVTLVAAADYLRGQLGRLRRGERMTQPSPAEGARSHDQWLYAHLRHAELHFGFLDLR